MKTSHPFPMPRRTFLRRSAAATAALSFPWLSPRLLAAAGKPGPNDRLQIGFIGLGGRARWILTKEALPGAQVIAVADCCLPRCDQAAKLVSDGDRWKKYQYYREMLEKEKLDAVFVETTTHARVLACIHAMQAGFNVYAEKPQSLTIAEGRILAKAVRKYNRVLQTGSQQRSMPINMHASKLVREGAIGKVHTVITCNFKGGKTWTNKPEEPIPSGLDWDQWCNQTVLRPYHSELQNAWNFFDCIRTRKAPHASVEVGHRATTVCHLVNICRTVQRKLRWDPQAEKFIGDEEANQLLSRPRRQGYELPKIT